MNIQLLSSSIHELSIKHFPLEEAGGKTEEDRFLNLSYKAHFPEDDKRTFANLFRLHLEHPGEFVIDIEYISWFQASDEITEEFQESSFVKINAPAIAYPYLRSAVSSITLLSGYPTAILPTINFVEFSKENKEED